MPLDEFVYSSGLENERGEVVAEPMPIHRIHALIAHEADVKRVMEHDMANIMQNSASLQQALRVAFSAAQSTANRHRAALLKVPNVIDVRPGYKFTGGWITHTPAIVVTVLRKDPPASLREKDLLPTDLDGVPVDVAPATPAEQLRYLGSRKKGGTRGAAAVGIPDPEPYLEPVPRTEEHAEATARGTGDGGRRYKEPRELKLAPVTGAMTLLCHCSPDTGWASLKKHLSATEKTLTVAMYDFGAPYIFDTIAETMAEADGPFVLNLDRKSNPQREGDLTEQQIEDRFRDDLADKFEYSTAAVGYLYPTAYHIKVAVRDSKSVWVSSGNWQQSNQPEEDATALDEASQRQLLGKRNREWHVIAENAKLAKTFEAYIKYDVKGAEQADSVRGAVVAAPADMPELIVPQADFDTRAAKLVKIFRAKKFSFTAADPVKVQPILTPDNYGKNILKLIRSAKERLFFQNQYIKIYQTFPDSGNKPGLKELVDALLDRMNADVDVRIILRNNDARSMIQALQTYGFDVSKIKLLAGCHNKGIIVDSSKVLVSSQNYSADGVRFNRDAGLLIDHPKVAKYFEMIFEYDWEHRAYPQDPGERGAMPLLPEVAEGAPAGSRAAGAAETISWADYYQD